mmetsp:Transcript_8255/g.21242  ORF Transcript_8255/g.21242 Transcript_8255/m.21242 type:complete len:287 (-) Transcript_8255:268-1128(-)
MGALEVACVGWWGYSSSPDSLSQQEKTSLAHARTRTHTRARTHAHARRNRPGREQDWGNSQNYYDLVRQHGDEMRAKPCWSTYETGWDAVTRGFGPDNPPILFTMLRQPLTWVVSAVEHDRHAQRNDGLTDLYKRGCLTFDGKCYRVSGSYDYITGSYKQLVPGGGKKWDYNGSSLEQSKINLRASIFGITEYFQATECLWRFQLGQPVTREKCECGTVAPKSTAASKKGGRDLEAAEAAHRELTIHVGSMHDNGKEEVPLEGKTGTTHHTESSRDVRRHTQHHHR